jgi:lysophospholipase L1-like esterase
MSTWFERNPRKTLLLLISVVILAAAVATEKMMAWRSQVKKSGIVRVIRLREAEPLFVGKFAPSQDNLRLSDSLENKDYPFRTDADGFIMPSRVHKKPDLTLVFLGGSTTACYYVDEEERFPFLAGRLLEKDLHLKVNSYNSGVGGNYSLHSLDILLNKVIPLNPDVVVMMHNINDLTILMFAKSYWNQNFKNGKTAPIIVLKKRYIDVRLMEEYLFPHLYTALKNLERKVRRTLRPKKAARQEDELRDIRGKKMVLDKEFLVREFKMNQQTFINICRARKITPVLMTMANRLTEHPDALVVKLTKGLQRDHGISYQDYKETFDLFNQAIRQVGRENHVLVIDLARAVPQKKEYIYDLVHFNNRGSKLAAAVIAKDLEPLLASIKARRPKPPEKSNLLSQHKN